jgi:hypothetical protein
MNAQKINCPVCGNEDALFIRLNDDHLSEKDCPQCGKFSNSSSITDMVSSKEIKSHLLSHYIRTKYDNGEIVKLDTNNINELKNLPEIPLVEKADLLLKVLAAKAEKYTQAIIASHPKCIALAALKDEEELGYLFNILKENDYANVAFGERDEKGKPQTRLWIKPKGWNKIEELNRQTNFKQGFVAMWFDNSMDEYGETIKQAIKDAGFEPMLLKGEYFLDKIDDKIIAEIKRSRFVVADVSGERPNVYYEAGFAQGLKIPVIWTIKEGHKLHFDTQQFQHITYNNAEKLKEALYQKIRAVID